MKKSILKSLILLTLIASSLNTAYSFTIDLRKPKPCVNFPSYLHHPSFQLYYEFSVFEGLLGDTNTYHYKIYIEQNGHSDLMYEYICEGDDEVSGYINLQNFASLCFNEKAVFRLDVRKYYQQGFFNTEYGYFIVYKSPLSCNYYSISDGERVILNNSFMPITIYGTCGGLASGTYFIKRSKITFTINGDFRDSIPVIEPSLCLGYSGSGPNNQNLWAAVTDSTETMFRFVTFTYEVFDILGRYWGNVPCSPEKATVVYKYIKKPVIGNLTNYPFNPSPGNSVSYISCDLLQGNGNLNYQWRDSNGTRHRVLLTPLENNRARFQVFFNERNTNPLFEDSAYYYFVKVSNQTGSTGWVRRKVRFNLNPVGCPEVVFSENKDSLTENAILINSKTLNTDVSDYMILQNPFIKDKSEIKFAIKENQNDKTYLDFVSLYLIETGPDEDAAVTDDGEIISYKKEEGKAKILKNGGEDVSFYLEECDDQLISLSENEKLDIITDAGQGRYLILKLSSPYNKYESAGNISAGDGFSYDFYSRDYENIICIKLDRDDLNEISLTAGQDIILNQVRILNKREIKSIRELSIKSALDMDLNDLKGLISNQDGEYAVVNNENRLYLTFENSECVDCIAHYMLKAKGRIYGSESKAADSPVKHHETKSMNILYENYPNPFNPITLIRYRLENRSNIRLKIFDITGKEIITLSEGIKEPGEYKAEFDGSNLPSGIYLYRLEAGENILTRKMMLLK